MVRSGDRVSLPLTYRGYRALLDRYQSSTSRQKPTRPERAQRALVERVMMPRRGI